MNNYTSPFTTDVYEKMALQESTIGVFIPRSPT